MSAIFRMMVEQMLTPDQKAEISRVLEALSTQGTATTEQQLPGVGHCRITIEKIP